MISQKFSDNIDEYIMNLNSQSNHRVGVSILYKNMVHASIGSQTYVFRFVTPLQSNTSLNFLISGSKNRKFCKILYSDKDLI